MKLPERKILFLLKTNGTNLFLRRMRSRRAASCRSCWTSRKRMQTNKYPYLKELADRALFEAMPYLPLTLELNGRTRNIHGLLDSGSTVNVLPYQIGLELGAVWENQRIPLSLVGNLANFEARALFVNARISGFPSVDLAFAWTKSEYATLILGQTNFFSLFDVCFLRQDKEFEIKMR